MSEKDYLDGLRQSSRRRKSRAGKITEQVKSEVEAELNKELGSTGEETESASIADDREKKSPREGVIFQDVTTKDIQVELVYYPRLNYALVHNKIPLIHSLKIRNHSVETGENGLVKCWVAPDYGEPWKVTFSSIPTGEEQTIEEIHIPLDKNRLMEVTEAEKASLRVEVYIDDKLVHSNTFPIEVLAYNEWFFHPELLFLIASFVFPNDQAVEETINAARDFLVDLTGNDSFSGYQEDKEKVRYMIESIYQTIQEDLDLSYINPPASFESTGQKIFTPSQILKHRRGTCLDLSLFYAAILERIGLHPLILLVPGHALLGCWMRGSEIPDNAVIEDMQMIDKLDILWINSTTFTDSDNDFETAVEDARKILSECNALEEMVDIDEPEDEDPEITERTFTVQAIDIFTARGMGAKPLPL